MGATNDIVTKAMKDSGFRERLLKDPKNAIASELGIQFPEGVTIQVHENSLNAIYLVLPGPATSEVRNLSEKELSEVVGGLTLSATQLSSPTLTTSPTFSSTTLGCSTTMQPLPGT